MTSSIRAGEWIPLSGALDDYIAHTSTCIEKVVFVGAIDRFGDANAAIRADGIFAPHAIYVESADDSTFQATLVLAAFATNLALASPKWGAARLKQGLMDLAREETIDHATGGSTAGGSALYKRRAIKVIRPEFAPTGAMLDCRFGDCRRVVIDTVTATTLAKRLL